MEALDTRVEINKSLVVLEFLLISHDSRESRGIGILQEFPVQ